MPDVLLAIFITDAGDKRIFTSQLKFNEVLKSGEKQKQIYSKIPPVFLTPNTYNVNIGIHIPNIQVVDEVLKACRFEIYDNGSEFSKFAEVDYGCVFVNAKWIY